MKILVVEDNSIVSMVIAMVAGRQNHEVYIVNNGIEAMGIVYISRDIDLLIVDLTIPGMDGYEMVKYMRTNERYHKLPVIILTDEIAEELTNINIKYVNISVIDKRRFDSDYLETLINLYDAQYKVKKI